MKHHIAERIWVGFGFAGIVNFIAVTIIMVNGVDVEAAVLWQNMLGAIIMGVYFSVASLIFEKESWSPLKQTSIHLSISLAVFYTLAGVVGWVPFEWKALLISTAIFITIYFVFWFFIGLYLKRMTSELNKNI
ncbi:DUF3021 domain-containing protein [Halobacillus campisalis]|uniref:DUF3021 domain-containing protein n=1 Tax=Halobacillus campisalis TaxID=435909 RepID=A0ABW2JY45_9BACI|nr:DUF3021 domain-containing protein [Halobacillus campisalis]